MKNAMLGLSVLLLIFIVGCGGDDANVPPPVVPNLGMNNPIDQQQLKDMFALAQQAKGGCAESGTQSMLPLILMMNSGGAGGVPPILPPIGGQCSDPLINFIMMFTTMKNGQYANYPEPRRWFVSQLGGMMNMIGRNFQNRGVPLNPNQLPQLYTAGWQLFQRDVFSDPRFQSVRPQVCGGVSEYGLGC